MCRWRDQYWINTAETFSSLKRSGYFWAVLHFSLFRLLSREKMVSLLPLLTFFPVVVEHRCKMSTKQPWLFYSEGMTQKWDICVLHQWKKKIPFKNKNIKTVFLRATWYFWVTVKQTNINYWKETGHKPCSLVSRSHTSYVAPSVRTTSLSGDSDQKKMSFKSLNKRPMQLLFWWGQSC